MKPVRIPKNRLPSLEERHRVLAELAKCGDKGTCHVFGVMDGGALAALVQLGLAERMPEDAIGGNRYRINSAGLDLLEASSW